MSDCIFCRILKGEIPVEPVFKNDNCIIIPDIKPLAKSHYLLIPTAHYADIGEATDAQARDLGECLRLIPALSDKLGLTNGYRLIVNSGEDGGQEVKHLHVHILGGQRLKRLTL